MATTSTSGLKKVSGEKLGLIAGFILHTHKLSSGYKNN